MVNTCEWDPQNDCEATVANGCQSQATVSLGRGKWHLCDSCAGLPRFRRYRRHGFETARKQPVTQIVDLFAELKDSLERCK